MLGRGELECGMVSVYHSSEKNNSSLFEFLPKFSENARKREKEREREIVLSR